MRTFWVFTIFSRCVTGADFPFCKSLRFAVVLLSLFALCRVSGVRLARAAIVSSAISWQSSFLFDDCSRMFHRR